MCERVDLAVWQGLAIYGLGLLLGFFVGFTLRWALEKPVDLDLSDVTMSGEATW